MTEEQIKAQFPKKKIKGLKQLEEDTHHTPNQKKKEKTHVK